MADGEKRGGGVLGTVGEYGWSEGEGLLLNGTWMKNTLLGYGCLSIDRGK